MLRRQKDYSLRKRLDSRKILTFRPKKRPDKWKMDMKKWNMNSKKRWRMNNTRKMASYKKRMHNMSSTLVRKWRLKKRLKRNRSNSKSIKIMMKDRCSSRTQENLKIRWNMSQKR